MTVSLLVFVPVALFALMAAFCFVGCGLDATGTGYGQPTTPTTPAPFTKYSDTDVIPFCVAYWPLNDAKMQTTALDVGGKAQNNQHDGEYKSNLIEPASFPCAPFTFSPTTHSAQAPGDLTLGVPGIVPGDTDPPYDPANPTKAVTVNGAFVTVPANSVTNPASAFSVEMWVRPEWGMIDGNTRMLIDSRDAQGAASDQLSGFGIWINDAGDWEGVLGVQGMGTFVLVPGEQAALNVASHIVLTYDGADARLYVNGSLSSAVVPAPNFVPNTTQPLTIGVGLSRFPHRSDMPKPPEPAFPLLPFNGTIQCVAIYATALDQPTIATHTDHGNGKGDPG